MGDMYMFIIDIHFLGKKYNFLQEMQTIWQTQNYIEDIFIEMLDMEYIQKTFS